jgi:hypothetical protein
MREPHCTKVTSDAHYCIRSGSDYCISEKRSSRLDEAGDAYRVNAIVGSFKPERTRPIERRQKIPLLLA